MLCRFTAQVPFMPSSILKITSDGTPRTVDVIGATVTVAKCPTTLERVRISTGLCLLGGGKRHSRTSPRLRVPAMTRHPPTCGNPPRVADGRDTRADPAPPVRADADV